MKSQSLAKKKTEQKDKNKSRNIIGKRVERASSLSISCTTGSSSFVLTEQTKSNQIKMLHCMHVIPCFSHLFLLNSFSSIR